MKSRPQSPVSRRVNTACTLLCALGIGWGGMGAALAAGSTAHEPPAKKGAVDIEATSASNPKEVGSQVREALGLSVPANKKLTVTVKTPAVAGHGSTPAVSSPSARQKREAQEAKAKAAAAPADAHGSEVHWNYAGENGPQAWGTLKPEFNLCAIGKRQSPINIEDGTTLMGPAEPLQFNYTPSNASVVNNGHTVQVDVQGENAITVRGSSYRLVQFHFHTPSEEQINGKRFAMVVHLVHKNDAGQLAVVAVLMDIGSPNNLIDKVWTYMPLDAGDRVSMPKDVLDLNELLPADQRYYQFMGSLTTPPCSEGVLWLVLKQPVKISKMQHRLFTQLYPNNARPVQPVNGRPVRDAL